MDTKISIFTMLVLLMAALVSSVPTGRIVGGFPITIETVPYQVSIQMVESDGVPGHFCGGSIISEKFILTASHCVESLEIDDLAILVGSTNNDQKAKKNIVKRIIMNENYDGESQDYDVALLELSKPLKFNARIQAIPLPKESDNIQDGKLCLVTGWGDTNRKISFGKNRLRGVEVPIVNQKTCENDYSSVGGVTSRMFCAGFQKGGKDSCQGDSGGPLACTDHNGNLTLNGIVSWGMECAKPNMPGVYTRVQAVRKWIHDKTGL